MSDLKEKIKILPCIMCEDMIYCDECGLEKEAEELYNKVRAEVIKEIALKIQKIKDNHNENPRLYPINYGTLCGICTDLWEQLKERNKWVKEDY